MKELNHRDYIKIATRGKRYPYHYGTIGTIAGYGIECGEDPMEGYGRAIKFGHSLNPWGNQEAACLSSSPGYYERKQAQWDAAILVVDGEQVLIEGKVYTLIFNGDYSDFLKFVPVEEN